MLKKILISTFAVACCLSVQMALAADGFVISKKKNRILGDVTDVEITWRLDTVNIQDIVVNRGNCRLLNGSGEQISKPIKPFPMKFGGIITVGAANYCIPIEVEIKTDKGNFKVEWEK